MKNFATKFYIEMGFRFKYIVRVTSLLILTKDIYVYVYILCDLKCYWATESKIGIGLFSVIRAKFPKNRSASMSHFIYHILKENIISLKYISIIF